MDKRNLVHNVFLTLKDASEAAIKTLIKDCYYYLEDQPGIIYFSAGGLVPEHEHDVNVRDFHVGIHMVFSDKSYHDQYQDAEKHIIFVDKHKANWSQIRVFDTYIG